MDPTASIFLGIFAGLLLAGIIVNIIQGQVQRKNILLRSLSGCQHMDMELLTNSKVFVAVLNATETVFADIEDEEERNELYKVLASFTETVTTDNSSYTMIELTKKLSNDSFLDEYAHLSTNMKKLTREALKAINTMNSDDSKTTINLCLFKRMVAFGLNSVRLTDVHVHA